MPFFRVVTISKTETEVIVEAENMSAASTLGLQAVRAGDPRIRTSQPFFEEAHIQKLPDSLTVAEAIEVSKHRVVR